MDSFASLAHATEEPNKHELLNRAPQGKDEYIISRKMLKHIIVMSIYEIIVCYTIVFSGEYWIPESPNHIPNRNGLIYPGRPYKWNNEDLYAAYKGEYGPSRHFTVVFTVFVFMQVINMINTRKINDEWNMFHGIHKNFMFIFIWCLIVVVQVLMTQFTQDVFYCSRSGLYYAQWLICFGFSFLTIPIDTIAKCIPDRLCPTIGKKKRKAIDSGPLNFRKKRTNTLSLGNAGSVHKETPK